MEDKVCVITGATSGVGLAAAEALASLGASIVAIGRDTDRCRSTLARLRELAPGGEFRTYTADLSRLTEMKRLAETLLQKEPRIDVLINNAGALFTRRFETEDGLERTFALNHMAPFVVTGLLRDRLRATPGVRVITTSSRAHEQGRVDFADLQARERYNGFRAYANSKLANILFTRELSRRMEDNGVTVNCFHPGFVASRFGRGQNALMSTLLTLLRPLAVSPKLGAETGVYLAASPNVSKVSGRYFVRGEAVEPSSHARDDAAARRLWDESVRLAGLEELQFSA